MVKKELFWINTVQERQIISCILEGRHTYKEAKTNISEFLSIVSPIEDIKNYELMVDASKLEVCAEEAIPLIKEATGLLMDTPFKDRQIILPDDLKACSQVLYFCDDRFRMLFKREGYNVKKNINFNSFGVSLLKMSGDDLELVKTYCNRALDIIEKII